jgi:hypothetical protein
MLLPAGAVPENVLPRVGLVVAPSALGGGPTVCPLEVLASETVTRLQPVEPRVFAPAGIESGFSRALRLYRYFLRVTFTFAMHCLSPIHLVSVIERSKWARDLGAVVFSGPGAHTQGTPRHGRPARPQPT